MLYTIWERYEYRSSKGVEWTKWFQLFNVKPAENKDELKDKLKEFDKATDDKNYEKRKSFFDKIKDRK